MPVLATQPKSGDTSPHIKERGFSYPRKWLANSRVRKPAPLYGVGDTSPLFRYDECSSILWNKRVGNAIGNKLAPQGCKVRVDETAKIVQFISTESGTLLMVR